MRNKIVIYIGVGLMGLALLAFLFVSPNPGASQNAKPATTTAVQGFEPPFVQEGELTFFDHETEAPVGKIAIEIADNEQETTQGLMYRKFMEEDQGMLFLFDSMEPRSFWMKNTHISLDIIYVDEYYRIVSIAKQTTPYSEISIPSEAPAQYVVEVNAGYCDRHGIQKGDRVQFNRIPAQ
ncbi:DUF192 domain-containing protein [Pontibacter sp. G13]|uniref:DUF192 domain-containing protein n=1 Tax=Pontibacter sp. G13 TaxID=3074898 RepID=UPI00288A9954|nr:DUF192 domain-containing protein [Pontibacter sp. G13]WNJ19227.1 DUF192 domain-containing protein [Pontibacter sp. G13]